MINVHQSLTRWLTTPTVLAQWPIAPRWHLALKQVRMLLVLAAYSLAWFWFGGQTLPVASASAPPAAGALAAVATQPAPAPDTVTPEVAATEVLPPEDAAGLRIDTFRISAVYGYPNRLRYELALSNKGRKLVGRLQFVMVGEQNGELSEIPLVQPSTSSDAQATNTKPTDTKARVEVAHLLNTRGYLDLPEGYVVHKVMVQVVEGSQPRVAQVAPMWPT